MMTSAPCTDELSRRALLAALGATGAIAGFGGTSFASETTAAEDAKLVALFDRIYDGLAAVSPEWATQVGRDAGPARAMLDDRSEAGDRRRTAHWEAGTAALEAIDPARLSPARARQREIALGAMRDRARVSRRYGYGSEYFFAYRLTQFTGAYMAVPGMLESSQTVETAADVDAYLSRLAGFARTLDQETERQAQDARRGIAAPDFILDLVLANLEGLRVPAKAEAQLAGPLKAKAQAAGLPDRSGEAARIVERLVLPALDRQIAATRAIRRKAGAVPGVWRLPDGEAYYADALRFSTTSDMTPDEAHAVGLEKIRDIETRLDGLLRREGHESGSVAERLETIKADPAQYFPDSDAGREALLAYFSADIERVKAAMPRAFRTMPARDVEVKRMPLAYEGLGPSAAYMASSDSARKPSVIVDLKDMAKWPRFSLKTLCRHEGIPGHHLQHSLMQEAVAQPKLLNLFATSAYGEGWALYAEQLTEEMGLYEDDPLGEIGMWQSLLYRAARIVVDTGIHRKRWSRAQAFDFMLRTTAMPRALIEAEINRYAIIPGQACGYMLGAIEWTRIRAKAEKRAGAAFDLPAFHDVLLDGPMPMAMLEARVLQRLANI